MSFSLNAIAWMYLVLAAPSRWRPFLEVIGRVFCRGSIVFWSPDRILSFWKSGSFTQKGNFIAYLWDLGSILMAKSIKGTCHMASGTTWRVKDVSTLRGGCSSTCIYISWQNPHLCTHSISRTGWKPDALLCTMQLTPWDVYMKDTVMMGFILRRWLIGSLQCCPFHATL